MGGRTRLRFQIGKDPHTPVLMDGEPLDCVVEHTIQNPDDK
jgi:hypothetical protein